MVWLIHKPFRLVNLSVVAAWTTEDLHVVGGGEVESPNGGSCWQVLALQAESNIIISFTLLICFQDERTRVFVLWMLQLNLMFVFLALLNKSS